MMLMEVLLMVKKNFFEIFISILIVLTAKFNMLIID